MTNNETKKWLSNPKNIAWSIVAIVIFIFALYILLDFDLLARLGIGSVAKIFASLKAWLEGIISAILAAIGGGGGFNPLPTEPETDVDCRDYNINREYYATFGATVMNSLQSTCTAGGGIWTGTTNEVSCFVGHPADVECNSVVARESEELCDSLGAVYECDNENGVYGCFCHTPIPDADESKWECGEYYVGQGVCSGYCSEGTCQVKDIYGHLVCDCFTDEGEQEQDDGLLAIRLFVTDLAWNGALGGTDGADAKCQTQAVFAGLGGTWRAVISDDSQSAKDRVPSPKTPHKYVLLDGTIVGYTVIDLFDGGIDHPININEKGNLESGSVWTGSTTAGVNSGNNCHNWGWVSAIGTVGSSTSNAWSWIDMANPACDTTARLYCVEVM